VALAKVHWSTTPGDDVEWELPEKPRVDEVVTGAGFEPVGARRARRLRTLPDTVGAGMRPLET
jgi:hypothetical protein